MMIAMMIARILTLVSFCSPMEVFCLLVLAFAVATTDAAKSRVRYASNQEELVNALGDYRTVVLTANILLETSTAYMKHSDTGLVIENIHGLIIDGAGFTIDGQGKMRCMYVGDYSEVELMNVTLQNGRSRGDKKYAVRKFSPLFYNLR